MRSLSLTTSGEIDAVAEQIQKEERLEIVCMGCVTNVMVRSDKNGNPWAIVMLEDMEGSLEVKFFSKSYDKFRDLLENDRVLVVKARVSKWNDRASVDIYDAMAAEELRDSVDGLRVFLDPAALGESTLLGIKDMCRRLEGRHQLMLTLESDDHHLVDFSLGGKFRIALTPASIQEFGNLAGVSRVDYLFSPSATRSSSYQRQ